MELHSPCLYDHHVGCRLISFLTVIADLHLSLLSLVLVLKLAGVEMQVQPSWPRPLYWVVYPPSATDSFHLFQISLFVLLRPYCLRCCRRKAFLANRTYCYLFLSLPTSFIHFLNATTMAFKSSSRTKIMSSTLSPNHFPSVLDPASASSSPRLSTSPTPEPQRRASRSPSIANESTAREGYSGITHPITYTPTTNRISKAKKGKRVHACEYPGCDKVSP